MEVEAGLTVLSPVLSPVSPSPPFFWLQEEALFDEMKEIQAAVEPDNVVFVMDATQGQAVYDQVPLPSSLPLCAFVFAHIEM